MKEFGPFRLDTVNQCLWRSHGSSEAERVLLTPTEFAVLQYLVERAGRLVTHDELLDAVWPGMAIEPQAVKSKVFHVRRVLGDDSRQPRFIETVQRRGYRFVAAIEGNGTQPVIASPRSTPLVGREHTLNELWGSLRAARSGKLEIVFVSGEAGIGKTSVVDEFCRQVVEKDRSIRVARGQCVEGFGSKEAFYPVLEAVGQLCEGPEAGRVVDTLASRAPTWLVQFPALLTAQHRETLKQEILGATRERMLREIADALESIAQSTPLLIVLEDLHWADPSTFDLISALARHRKPARIMVVGTYRSTDIARSTQPLHVLKRDLIARQLCREIVLEPLREPDIALYLISRGAAPERASELAALLHRHTEGNPLFAIAVLEHLLERGLLEPEHGWRLRLTAAELAAEIPESLRQMISAQIERLTDVEQQVLEVGSIAGMSFASAISAPTVQMDPDVFEDCCDTLVRRGQVLRLGSTIELPDDTIAQRYDFVHALYREVLYQRQSPARRAVLHRRRAERIEEVFRAALDDVASELAHHFEKGAAWESAVKYRRRAAELAVGRYSLEEARANLQHALDLAGKLPVPLRPVAETEILGALSEMDVVTFHASAVDTLSLYRERAARYGMVDAEAKALVNLVLPLAWRDGGKALEVIEQALNLTARQLQPLARARTRAECMARRVAIRGWSVADVSEAADAMQEIRRHGTATDIAWHVIDSSFLDYYRSEYRAAHSNALAALDVLMNGEDANRYLHYAVAHWNCDLLIPWSLDLLGEWGAALRELDARIARAERNADWHRCHLLRLNRTRVQLNAMDFANVRATALSLLPALPRHVEDPLRRMCLALLGAAEVGLGNFDEALEHLLMARREMDEQPVIVDWYHRLMLQCALTNLWIGRGDHGRASEEGARFIEQAMAIDERTWRALACEASARASLAAGEIQGATEHVDRALGTVSGVEAPVAAWQVYATAAEVARARDDAAGAAHHKSKSQDLIRTLASSLGANEELRHTFLAAPMVRRALAEPVSAPRLRAEAFHNRSETTR